MTINKIIVLKYLYVPLKLRSLPLDLRWFPQDCMNVGWEKKIRYQLRESKELINKH